MWDQLHRPAVYRSAVAIVALLALLGGWFGATKLLDRPQAADVVKSVPATSSPTAVPGPGPIVVHGAGDVNLDPRQLHLLSEGYDAPWTGVRDLFASDDVTIVNLECGASPLGDPVPDKQFNFKCPRGFEAMRKNGVDVANQGNNHSMDYGKAAMLDARSRLSRAGVAPVGTGNNATEANEPAIIEVRGKTVAVLGFGGVIPFRDWLATGNRPGMADGDDIASMVRAVEAADALADYVFVTIHWGAELDTAPRADDVERAHAMIDAGADGIFGHHAHRLQPLESYKERPIFWGLGNFVWPRPGPTAVGEITVNEDGTFEACLIPGRTVGGRPTLDPPGTCPKK